MNLLSAEQLQGGPADTSAEHHLRLAGLEDAIDKFIDQGYDEWRWVCEEMSEGTEHIAEFCDDVLLTDKEISKLLAYLNINHLEAELLAALESWRNPPPRPPPPLLWRCEVDKSGQAPEPRRWNKHEAPEPSPPALPPATVPLRDPLPLVSILCPTTGERGWTHEHCYRMFEHQDWPKKELVVLDTGPTPSPFFTSLADSRVRYTHMRAPAKPPMPLSASDNQHPPDAGASSVSLAELAETLQALSSAASPATAAAAAARVASGERSAATAPTEAWRSEDKYALTWPQGAWQWVRADDCEDDAPSVIDESGGGEKWVLAWEPTMRALARAQTALAGTTPAGTAADAHQHLSDGLTSDAEGMARLMSEGMSLGAKRNWLAAHANGDVHANFDDDDVYLPNYVTRMVGALASTDAELVTLSVFLEFNAALKQCTRVGLAVGVSCAADDPALQPAPPPQGDPRQPSRPVGGHDQFWGYGFSYVHTARLARCCPYPPTSFGEDYARVLDASRRASLGLLKPCYAFADPLGDAVVCHVSHGANTSAAPRGQMIVDSDEWGEARRDGDGAAAGDDKFAALFSAPIRPLLAQACAHGVVRADYVVWQKRGGEEDSSSAENILSGG